MSKVTSDSINKKVSEFSLADKARIGDYGSSFYDHLSGMLKFDLIESNVHKIKDKFTETEYYGLVQYIFEHTSSIEKSETSKIDWNVLGDAREVMKKKIKSLLGKEGDSETLKPMISFTVDSFENSLMYYMMHPESSNNPWDATDHILKSGYLFLASDKKDLLDSYSPKIYKDAEEDYRGNIGIVAKVKNEKAFSGFVIDNRLSSQTLVYEYLKSFAKGFSHAKSMEKIIEYLTSVGKLKTRNGLYYSIILPLKRAGLVGSSSTGFFYIEDENDLRRCFEFHKTKYDGLKRTMDIYEARANKMGFNLNIDG